MLELSECTRDNFCLECDNKKCIFCGKAIADCPKYYCDRLGEFFEDCESCTFLKEFKLNSKEATI